MDNLDSGSRGYARQHGRYEMIGMTPEMEEAYRTIEAVASIDAPVMLIGETGTGKEMAARAIHYSGSRHREEYVPVNCGAFTEDLLQDELFGHERGAFTGADSLRPGYFEMARGGTIFLDELTESSRNVQVSLLRVLEDGKFLRLGGTRFIETDARVIAASSLDLPEAVEQGKLYEPLRYRLEVVPIHLPPLRRRISDIPLLLEYFRLLFSEKYDREIEIDEGAVDYLKTYEWPGNVRQLRNVLERAAILEQPKGRKSSTVSLARDYFERALSDGNVPGRFEYPPGMSLRDMLHKFRHQVTRDEVERQSGNVTAAAKALDTPRSYVYKILNDGPTKKDETKKDDTPRANKTPAEVLEETDYDVRAAADILEMSVEELERHLESE